jgi:hypothetical protein
MLTTSSSFKFVIQVCLLFAIVSIISAVAPEKEFSNSNSNSNTTFASPSNLNLVPAPEFESIKTTQDQRQGRNGYVDIYFSPFGKCHELD